MDVASGNTSEREYNIQGREIGHLVRKLNDIALNLESITTADGLDAALRISPHKIEETGSIISGYNPFLKTIPIKKRKKNLSWEHCVKINHPHYKY